MIYITKKKDLLEPFNSQKILDKLNFIKNMNALLDNRYIDINLILEKLILNLYSGISIDEIYNQCAEIGVNLSTSHPSYSILACNILVDLLHLKTSSIFSEKIKLLSTINKDWLQYVLDNKEIFDKIIKYDRDYRFDYFGFKTLEKAYLLKDINKTVIERPQDMFLRTAITLQLGNIDMIKETYDKLSLGYYIHASPTLFNSGTNNMQLSSCFIEDTEVITMNGIKNIQNVIIGDEIVTHTGRVQKVLQLHKNELLDRKIMLLSVNYTKSIYVTNNHKFWSITDYDLKPKWRSVDELSDKCFIAIPNYSPLECNEILNKDNILDIDLPNIEIDFVLQNIYRYIKNYYVLKSDIFTFNAKNYKKRDMYDIRIQNLIIKNLNNKFY